MKLDKDLKNKIDNYFDNLTPKKVEELNDKLEEFISDVETFEDSDLIVSYETNEIIKSELSEELLKFCKDNSCYNEETLFQSDRCLLELPDLVAKMINLMNFKTQFKKK